MINQQINKENSENHFLVPFKIRNIITNEIGQAPYHTKLEAFPSQSLLRSFDYFEANFYQMNEYMNCFRSVMAKKDVSLQAKINKKEHKEKENKLMSNENSNKNLAKDQENVISQEKSKDNKSSSTLHCSLTDVYVQSNVLQITIYNKGRLVKALLLNRNLNQPFIERREDFDQIKRTSSDYTEISHRIMKQSIDDLAYTNSLFNDLKTLDS